MRYSTQRPPFRKFSAYHTSDADYKRTRGMVAIATDLFSHEVLVGLGLLILRRLHRSLVHPIDALLALWPVASGGLCGKHRRGVC